MFLLLCFIIENNFSGSYDLINLDVKTRQKRKNGNIAEGKKRKRQNEMHDLPGEVTSKILKSKNRHKKLKSNSLNKLTRCEENMQINSNFPLSGYNFGLGDFIDEIITAGVLCLDEKSVKSTNASITEIEISTDSSNTSESFEELPLNTPIYEEISSSSFVEDTFNFINSDIFECFQKIIEIYGTEGYTIVRLYMNKERRLPQQAEKEENTLCEFYKSYLNFKFPEYTIKLRQESYPTNRIDFIAHLSEMMEIFVKYVSHVIKIFSIPKKFMYNEFSAKEKRIYYKKNNEMKKSQVINLLSSVQKNENIDCFPDVFIGFHGTLSQKNRNHDLNVMKISLWLIIMKMKYILEENLFDSEEYLVDNKNHIDPWFYLEDRKWVRNLRIRSFVLVLYCNTFDKFINSTSLLLVIFVNFLKVFRPGCFNTIEDDIFNSFITSMTDETFILEIKYMDFETFAAKSQSEYLINQLYLKMKEYNLIKDSL